MELFRRLFPQYSSKQEITHADPYQELLEWILSIDGLNEVPIFNREFIFPPGGLATTMPAEEIRAELDIMRAYINDPIVVIMRATGEVLGLVDFIPLHRKQIKVLLLAQGINPRYRLINQGGPSGFAEHLYDFKKYSETTADVQRDFSAELIFAGRLMEIAETEAALEP